MGAHDEGVRSGEGVGPSRGGRDLVAYHADLNFSASVHVSHELNEGGRNGLSGRLGEGASILAHAAAVVGLSVGLGVCLSGGRSPSGS